MKRSGEPVLWHIPVSHYSEKVRWALDLKGVKAKLKAPPPGAHMAVALWMTRGAGKTFPILEIDGERFAESAEIVAALEATHPEPPLYPGDPAERARALELEQFFDDQLGPPIRQLVWHELIAAGGDDMRPVVEDGLPGPLRRMRPVVTVASRVGESFVNLRYRASDADMAKDSGAQVLAALDRLEAELGDGEFLVGERFSVADVTAASLFYPLVQPAEGPQIVTKKPPRLVEWWAAHEERPGVRYVERMFAEHRR